MKVALINYYARLIHNGQMKEEEVPKEHHDAVMKAYHELFGDTENPAQPSAE